MARHPSAYPFRLSILALVAACLVLAPAASPALPAGAATSTDSLDLLNAAVGAMGGEEAVAALATARTTGRSHGWALEQSERPDGPWIIRYTEFEEWVDLESARSRAEETNVSVQGGGSWTLLYSDGVVAIQRGERTFPGFSALVSRAEERLGLDPAGIVLTARRSRPGPARSVTYESFPHWLVPFDWKDGRVELLINARTRLPSAARLRRGYPTDNLNGMWGEMETEVRFHYWKLHPGGWRYPHQWETFRNGQPLETRMVLEVEPAAEVPEGGFELPAEVVAAAEAAREAPTRIDIAPGDVEEPVDVAEGVVLFPSWWNVMLVEQHDGVVVVEGPISSEYSEKIVAEVDRRFPGKPVKAVINTSDAWPHIGGLRTYAALGVAIWTQPRNAPLLGRLMAARYEAVPDRLERAPRAAAYEWVDSVRSIASSRNPVRVAPIDGEWSDRMLMVWLPDSRVLYGADLVFPPPPGGTGYFMPGYLEELRDAAAREGFDVETLVSMHAGPLPWSDVLAEIERVHGGR